MVLSIPHSCALTVRLKSPESAAGDRNRYFFHVRSTDEKRRATIELQPGTTVRGIIRDAITRRPIEGAVIVPIDSGSVADQEWLGRRAKSGPEGRYELRGVDLELGVTAYHPRYGGVNHRVIANTGSGMRFDVFLTPVDWETLKGIVRDPNGRPLEGVGVYADGAKFLTGRDGAYSVDYVIGRVDQPVLPTLEFRKDGYITRQCSRAEISKDGLVVLEHQIEFTGVVLAPDGHPVPRFEIWTAFDGPIAAQSPTADNTQLVIERSGRFTMRLNQEGRVLLRVQADGYADKEQSVFVHRAGTSCTVVLEVGAPVTGRIRTLRGGLKNLEARLVVRHDGARALHVKPSRGAQPIGDATK